MEYDISHRIAEQLKQIREDVLRRIGVELTDRDVSAIVHGLVDAATMGARVAKAALDANAIEAGETRSADEMGLRDLDRFPFED